MLLKLRNELRSALEDQEFCQQLLVDLESRCAAALAFPDPPSSPGARTTLFVIARICSSIEARLEQSHGSIEYHRLATDFLRPALLDAIDAIPIDSGTERLTALDELVSASIEFART